MSFYRTEPADENSWNFRNKLDPSAQHLQINRSYSISGGKRFYVGKDKNPLSFFLTAGHTTDYQYTDEIIRNTTTSATVYKDMNGKKYAENISQLALANVDFDMQNRHHISRWVITTVRIRFLVTTMKISDSPVANKQMTIC